mgnify:CR=1 FL=1
MAEPLLDVRHLSALMTAVMIWFINLDFIRPALMQDGTTLILQT